MTRQSRCCSSAATCSTRLIYPNAALNLLRQGLTDCSPAVRERTLTGISSLPRLWSSPSRDVAAAFGTGRRLPCPAPPGPWPEREQNELLEPAAMPSST